MICGARGIPPRTAHALAQALVGGTQLGVGLRGRDQRKARHGIRLFRPEA